MKRIIGLILLLASYGWAQSTSTSLGFVNQAHGAANWDSGLNRNFSLLDDFLAGRRALPSAFWSQISPTWTQISGKPATFPSDWLTIINKPTTFTPPAPTSSTPGGVFIVTRCPVGYHVADIAANGQLICTADATLNFTLKVNGVVAATGINTIDFACSSGLTCTAAVNQSTGVVTMTVTGSTATQAQNPTVDVLPGAYSAGQNITMACASPSPTIYRTTDGSTPTHGSGTGNPVAVTNTTIKAICASSGLSDSNVATFIYTLTAATASLAPSSLTFSTQVVGAASVSQPVTLTNIGNGSMTISSITASGDYSQTNNCGASLSASGTCTINVAFTPTTTGTRTGTLSISDSASGSPHTASLTGTGARPTASPAPSSLVFASQQINTNSTSQAITVTNGSAVTLTVSGVSITGTNASDFSQTNNCTTVTSGGTCTINVTFTPTAAGSRAASVSIADNAANSPQAVSLSGTGSLPPSPVASLSPSGLTFTSQKVGTSSTSKTLTLSNGGNATLIVSSVAITGSNIGDYAQTNNCTSVTAGNSCTINVTFTPQAAGSRNAVISIADNAAGAPHTATLTGTGAVPTATLSPSSLSFGNQAVGSTSAIQTVTLSNTSSVTLNLTSIAASGDFQQTNNCSTSLAGSSSCTISMTFSPTAAGSANGTLTVTDDGTGSPQSIGLSGTGTQPGLSLSTTAINFGTQSASSIYTRSVTVTNTGNANLVISSVTKTSDNRNAFSQSNNCGTVVPNGTCTITITWQPQTSNQSYGAGWQIISNAPSSPSSISASGTTNNL